MNEDKKLEEAVDLLKRVGNEYKTYGDLDNPEFEDTKKIAEAIKTVLQKLEELRQKEQNRIIGNIYEIKIEDLEPILKPYYIPKKKIEDKIKEIKENIPYLSKFNDWGNKEYTNKDIIDYNIEVLQELLEDK